MSRYADPQRCPDCRSLLPAIPARTACPACGLPLEGPVATELYSTLVRADGLLATLRAAAVDRASAPAIDRPVLVPGPGTDRPERPLTPDWREPGSTPARPPVRWTVPGVLLGLGGLCLVIGALVFLAVTWTVLGVGGRTTALLAVTTVAALGTALCARRGLRGAAETFATVSALVLVLDLVGAAVAGWFGDTRGDSILLAGSMTVVAATAAGNAALRRSQTGPLVALQLVASVAATVASLAALLRFGEDHATTTTAVSVVAALAVGEAARLTGQGVLMVAGRGLALALWTLLVVVGTVNVSDAWGLDGLGGADRADVEPLLVAAALAGAFAVATALRGLGPVVVRQGAGVVACWLVAAAAGAVLGDTVTRLVLVALAGVAVLVLVALVARPVAAPAGAAALGLAAVAAGGAATALVALVAGLAEEVSRQVDLSVSGLSPDLGATATVASGDLVAAPWTLPLAVLALALAGLLPGRERLPRPTTTWVRVGVVVGGPVVAVTTLCWWPVLLAAVVAAAVLAGLHLVAAARRTSPWPAEGDLALAVVWGFVAALVAVYHPLPALVVAAVATTVVTAHVLRSGSVVAGPAVPPLAALTAGAACWLLDVPSAAAGVAALVVTAVLTAVVGGALRHVEPEAHLVRLVMYVVALATCGVSALVALTGVADVPTWTATYLSLTAAGAAVVAIKERAREAAWVAAALELAAAWVRLADRGVETPEAYTLPLAAVLLAFGGWTLWRDRTVGTMRTLGPGLATALVPSLLAVVDDPISPRAAVLAGACALLVAAGAIWRLRAPLVSGAGVGAALAVVELAPYHDAVPRWLTLAVAGTVLVVAGVRWEYLSGAGRRGWGRIAELR